MHTKYIILVLFIIIIFVLYTKKENFTTEEAILNISKMYVDVSGSALYNDFKIYNNLDVLKKINSEEINTNSLNSNSLNTNSLNVNNNLDVLKKINSEEINTNSLNTNNLDVLKKINSEEINTNSLNSNNQIVNNNLNVLGITNINSLMMVGVDIRNYLPGCILYNQEQHPYLNNGSGKTFLPGEYMFASSISYFSNLTVTDYNDIADVAIIYPGYIVELWENDFKGNYFKITNAGVKPLRVNLINPTVENINDLYNSDKNSYKIEGNITTRMDNKITSLKVYLLDINIWKTHTVL